MACISYWAPSPLRSRPGEMAFIFPPVPGLVPTCVYWMNALRIERMKRTITLLGSGPANGMRMREIKSRSGRDLASNSHFTTPLGVTLAFSLISLCLCLPVWELNNEPLHCVVVRIKQKNASKALAQFLDSNCSIN